MRACVFFCIHSLHLKLGKQKSSGAHTRVGLIRLLHTLRSMRVWIILSELTLKQCNNCVFWSAYESCPVTAKNLKPRTDLSNRCMIASKGKRFFSPCAQTGSETHLVLGGSFPKDENSQREAGHSAPFNTQVKNVCSYAYTRRMPSRRAKTTKTFTQIFSRISHTSNTSK